MKNKGLFTKQLFIDTINAIQIQRERDIDNADKLGDIFDSYVMPYDNGELYDQLLAIMYYNFDMDNESQIYNNDIEYFIWELDFGKKYRPGCYTINGNPVTLKTAEDLWDVLNR